MRLPARLLLGAALAAALAACGRQDADPVAVSADTAPVAEAPTQLTPEDRLARTGRFLTARFGETAQRGAAWRDSDGSRPLHRYVCLDDVIRWEGIDTSVLGVCANRDDAMAEEAGLLDVFFLRPDAEGGLIMAAQLLGHPSGLGGVAAEPRLVALGPDQPALQLEQPVASDTVSRTDTVLLAAVGNGLREVVRFPSRIDNRLHLQCDGEEAAAADAGHADPDSLPGSATDSLPTGLAAAEIEARAAADCDDHLLQLTTTWRADSSVGARWWPLQTEQTGVACGQVIAQRIERRFDLPRQAYGPADYLEQCP